MFVIVQSYFSLRAHVFTNRIYKLHQLIKKLKINYELWQTYEILIVLGSGLYWNKMIYIFETDENCVKYDSRKTRFIGH